MRRGFTRKYKPLEILSEEQIETIHKGTLDVLRETGVTILHKKALEVFKKNDAQVDFAQQRVRIPEGLAEECLRKALSSFRIKARDPKNDIIIGGNTVYFGNFPGMWTIDIDTWNAREATKKENDDGVKILDALDNVDILGSYTPYYGFRNVPPCMAIPESVAAKFRNSSKVQQTGYAKNSEIFAIQMAQAIGTELIGSYNCAAPLTYYEESIESFLRHIEAGFPVSITSGAMMGGTAPATIAGATIINNAELIAGVVLAQLVKPKTRVYVGHFVFEQNMSTGSPAFGQIGYSLHQVVFNQIWRKYGIPRKVGCTGAGNSKKIDFQCGYEKAIGAFNAALSGANTVGLHGGIYGELTYHPIQSILDDDIAGMIGRFLEGVEVNDETLAIALIEEVGPIPGFYLNKEHTRKWWKKEQFIPRSSDRLTYPEWIKTGKKSALDYAKERMEEILATHKLKHLTDEQEKQIQRILKEARKYYKGKGLM